MRIGSLVAALVVAGLLIVSPDDGLFVMWKIVIPLLPLLFLVAPGVWRNICPLAASNQTPRVLGLTRGLTAPAWFKEYGYVVAISLFVLFVVLRKAGLDDNGPASALLLLGALTGRLRRRHVPEGQERLVLEHLPAAAGAADLRPDAVRARRQLALPAVRRLHDQLLRLQPEGRLPRGPQQPGPVLGRLSQVLRRRLPRPRARVLRGAGGARRDPGRRDGRPCRALHGGQRRVVRAARLVREGQHAQADHALRRARLQHLLLVRRAQLRRRDHRASRARTRSSGRCGWRCSR